MPFCRRCDFLTILSFEGLCLCFTWGVFLGLRCLFSRQINFFGEVDFGQRHSYWFCRYFDGCSTSALLSLRLRQSLLTFWRCLKCDIWSIQDVIGGLVEERFLWALNVKHYLLENLRHAIRWLFSHCSNDTLGLYHLWLLLSRFLDIEKPMLNSERIL